eukprot:CAMPEP_0206219240 /NCGR_PEP_ID=MMETSP0047_2-20121206/4217_1 /ASSEMBLY_ACC=CAM_ASM_000192 /TAXON_ID=195065 /ORGANISM="Chroomonas mesostigmatica_cf, Strain CCMP1168" /LENGTH=125 /DNA_ID=CAMNT_0053641777 /DNA_START=366 /DNA_END=740 /DNA_ORIENTATION=-
MYQNVTSPTAAPLLSVTTSTYLTPPLAGPEAVVTHVTLSGVTDVTVQAKPPIVTVTVPVPNEPKTVTSVPPAVEPRAGEMPVTLGDATRDAVSRGTHAPFGVPAEQLLAALALITPPAHPYAITS